MNQALIDELSAAVAAANAATTREEVGRAYCDLVGYDSAEEDPGASLEDLRGLLLDYVREVCYANDIHCAAAGLSVEDAS